MRLSLVVIGCLVGCNRLFGIDETGLRPTLDAPSGPDADPRVDLDRDRIADVEDPCIAPDTDLLVDSDFDGAPNNEDPCPFDRRSTSDSDGDGIGNVCDPSAMQERVRCLMGFSDPELDLAMWKPRGSPDAWVLWQPRVLAAVQPGALVADWPFESPGVTVYDVSGIIRTAPARFGVLARADLVSPDRDTGCILARDSTSISMTATGGGTAMLLSTTAVGVPFTLQMTIDPLAVEGPTLRCRVRFDGMSTAVTIEASPVLPPGRFGLVIEPGGSLLGIGIYER